MKDRKVVLKNVGLRIAVIVGVILLLPWLLLGAVYVAVLIGKYVNFVLGILV